MDENLWMIFLFGVVPAGITNDFNSMNIFMASYSDDDVRNQLKKLLSVIGHGSHKDETNVKNALRAVVDLCTDTNSAKDAIREIGGLSFLIDFVCSTSDSICLEHGLKALLCAVDNNTFNQKEVTKKDVFILIQSTLLREGISLSLLKSALLLTSSLLYQNSIAQNMFGELGCIHCYIDLYEELFPPFLLGHASLENGHPDKMQVSIELWQAVSAALCFSMTNPVHARNQEICAKLIPVALKLLQFSSYCEIVASVSSFLSSLIQDNDKNRARLIENSGLPVFKHCLEVGVVSSFVNKDAVLIPQQREIHATVSLVSLMDLCITDNESNAAALIDMGIVSLLSKFLFTPLLDNNSKTRILLTIGHAIELYPNCIRDILNEGHLKPFLRNCTESTDENLLKASQYIIHLLLMHEKFLLPLNPSEEKESSDIKLQNFNWKYLEEDVSCVTDLHAAKARQNCSDDESSEACASKRDSEESRIRLAKVKEERVKQYLNSLVQHTPSPIGRTASRTSRTPQNTASGKQDNSILTNGYFNRNFGSHPALSELSKFANSPQEKSKYSERKMVRESGHRKSSSVHRSRCNNEHRTQHCNQLYACVNCRPHPNCSLPKRRPSFGSGKESHGGHLYQNNGGYFEHANSVSVQAAPVLDENIIQMAESKMKSAEKALSFAQSIQKPCSPLAARNHSIKDSFVKPIWQPTQSWKKKAQSVSRKLSFSPFQRHSVCPSELSVDVVNLPAQEKSASNILSSLRQVSNSKTTSQNRRCSKGASSLNSEEERPFYEVILFPPNRCKSHGLINSVEKVWFKPVQNS